MDSKEAMTLQIKKKAKLVVPQKHIVPGGHELYLRCGVCETYEFRVFVVPVDTKAAISSLACVKCGTIRNVGIGNLIDGTGETTRAPTESELNTARFVT